MLQVVRLSAYENDRTLEFFITGGTYEDSYSC